MWLCHPTKGPPRYSPDVPTMGPAVLLRLPYYTPFSLGRPAVVKHLSVYSAVPRLRQRDRVSLILVLSITWLITPFRRTLCLAFGPLVTRALQCFVAAAVAGRNGTRRRTHARSHAGTNCTTFPKPKNASHLK